MTYRLATIHPLHTTNNDRRQTNDISYPRFDSTQRSAKIFRPIICPSPCPSIPCPSPSPGTFSVGAVAGNRNFGSHVLSLRGAKVPPMELSLPGTSAPLIFWLFTYDAVIVVKVIVMSCVCVCCYLRNKRCTERLINCSSYHY